MILPTHKQKALGSLPANLPVHNRSGKQKFQVLPSKKRVYRTPSVAQAPPGTAVPVTGTKVSRTNAASCQNPLCRGTYSSKITLRKHSPKEHAFTPGALWQSCSQSSKAANCTPTLPQLQRRAEHLNKPTAMPLGSKSANRTV